MWPALALALLTGQLPNPLMLFAADGSEHPLRFQGATVELDGQRYDATGRNRFVFATDAGGCGGATPELRQGALELRPERVELVITTTARPCKGKPRVVSRVARRYGYAPPTEKCVTTPRRYASGDQSLTLTDGCDGTVVLAVGDTTVVLSGKDRRFSGAAPTGAVSITGAPGANTVRVQGLGLTGTFRLQSP